MAMMIKAIVDDDEREAIYTESASELLAWIRENIEPKGAVHLEVVDGVLFVREHEFNVNDYA